MGVAVARTDENGSDVVRAMNAQGIPLTAVNYAVWSEYHNEPGSVLRRSIDILLSNGRTPDDRAMHRLYDRFCDPARESAGLREVAARALATLQDVRGAMVRGPVAPLRVVTPGEYPAEPDELPQLLEQLTGDTREMIRRSDLVARRLDQSAERIGQLERFLTEARQEAATDALTGLANRRSFDAALREAAGDAMNSGKKLAVLMADVDHFKQVNDRFGHDAGDDVLRAVADAMKQAVRGRDTVARYGGEEFAVILPDTATPGAISVAENLRGRVAAARPAARPGEEAVGVTISVGVAAYDEGERLSQFISRADSGLYQAKQKGRNRVALA